MEGVEGKGAVCVRDLCRHYFSEGWRSRLKKVAISFHDTKWRLFVALLLVRNAAEGLVFSRGPKQRPTIVFQSPILEVLRSLENQS
jgi:hypothetical protein